MLFKTQKRASNPKKKNRVIKIKSRKKGWFKFKGHCQKGLQKKYLNTLIVLHQAFRDLNQFLF